jgi:hypothetical protein
LNADRVSFATAVAVILLACDRSPPPGPSPEEERTLQRLKEEVARDRREDPHAKLAQAALAPPSQTRQTHPPPKQPKATLGGLTLEIVALTSSQVVEGARVSVATENRFLRVHLKVHNVGKRTATVDLEQIHLMGEGTEEAMIWGLARDVQRLAGTRALLAELPGGASRDFVLFFEVPDEALRGGLRLKAAGMAGAERPGGNEDAVISLD